MRFCVSFLLALAFARVAAAQSGAIRGVVVDRESGVGVAHAGVSVAGGQERLSSDSGQFRLVDLTPGDARVRIRRIGYVLLDTIIRVRGQGLTFVRIELTRAAIELAAVRTTDSRSCVAPGVPPASVDSNLAVAYQQLEQNALQYKLLTTSYPFRSKIERAFADTYAKQLRVTQLDTVEYSGSGQIEYTPGQVVQRKRGKYTLEIPTLAVFADSAFVATHCFTSGGVEPLKTGGEAVSIDFRVLDRISTADIDGSIYLDAKTFMIRRSNVWLSRTGGPIADFDSVNVETQYNEIAPGLPVIAQTLAFNHYRNLPKVQNPPIAVQEYHHLLSVQFVSATPGELSKGSIRVATQGESTRRQSGTVRLKIRVEGDATGPIAGADVALMRGLTTVVAHAMSDASGHAELDVGRDTGDFDLVVRKVGRARIDRVITLPDSNVAITMTLGGAVTVLPVQNVTAEEDEKHKRLYIDADAIGHSASRLDDATDIIEKLRPEMATTLAGQPPISTRGSTVFTGFCPGIQHLWINGQEIFPELVTTDETAVVRSSHKYASRSLPGFITSALAHINPSHIAEMHSQECWDLGVGKDKSNALFITLKPGVSYDPEYGSYVAAEVPRKPPHSH